VAWTEDRRENLIASFHSRDQYIALEGAFDRQAKLIALKADIVSNVGAYSCFPTTSGVEPLMAMAEMPGPYDVQQYQCLARGVLTNTCTMAPYRGVSRPVITFTLERLMDKAAAQGLTYRRGLDPEVPQTPPPISDSYSEFAYGVYKWVSQPYYRPIGAEPVPSSATEMRENIDETIDASVFDRWRADATYRPPNLVDWARRRGVDPATLATSVTADSGAETG